MFKLLYTYIKSLFIPTDITITLNGSHLTFTKEGDIKLLASRNFISNGKYIFQNCTLQEIEQITEEISITKLVNQLKSKEELCLEQLDLETL